jgi:UDP:flavonoid glycosyltransferase YjiC (YdhE family)
MRVLITTLHFHPLVPVAQALEAAGHEVAFACSPDNAPALEATGFRFFPAGTSMRELMPQLMPQLMAIPQEERDTWVLENVFGGTLPERIIPDLLDICAAWKPEILVRDMAEVGGCIVAEHLGMPHASVEVGVFVPAGWLAQIAGPGLNRMRSDLGLPPDPNLDMLYRYLHLSFVPPSYQDPAAPLPPTAHALRTVIFDRSGDEALPAWVEQLPEQPTVYATLGTGFNNTPGVFEAIIEGLRDEPVNLIVTVGRDRDAAEFGAQPANVHIERYIPQSLLFPYCELVVSHGGWNTILAGFSFGLPQVVVPLGADQPQHARRCVLLGVGVAIEPAGLTPEAVRDAVREVLQNPGYRRNAERIRADMESLPGPEHAVELLEKLAAEKSPQLARRL